MTTCTRKDTRRRWLAGLLGLWLALAGLVAAQPALAADRVVIIVIDGCRPEYLDLAATPNLDALAARGTTYASAIVGHLANDTPSGHATLATGRLPRAHGVVAHRWLDASTGERVHITGTKAAVSGELLKVYPEAGIECLATRLKAASPDSYVASVSCGKFYAAMLMGGPEADEIASFPPEAPPDFGAQGDARDWTNLDSSAAYAAVQIARQHQPGLLMVNLPDCDRMGHETGGVTGPETMAAVVANVDAMVGEIVRAYEEIGVLDETAFVVTADHGMLPSQHTLEPEKLRAILADAGASGLANHEHIWLDDPDLAPAVAQAFLEADLARLKGVYYLDPGAQPPAYVLAPGPAIADNEDVAYRELLSTYAGPRGPNVVLILAEETVIGEAGAEGWFGVHTGITWHTQHIPMMLAGSGIRAGAVSEYPARLVDLAPTLCRVLGLAPADTDGVVLADALIDASDAEASAQSERERVWAPVRDALRLAGEREAAR